MAKRGRSRETGSSADTTVIASPELEGLLDPLPAPPVDPVTALDDFTGPLIPHDQRAFSFGDPERYTLDVGDRSGRVGTTVRGVVTQAPSRATSVSPSVGFAEPRQVAICVRRKERREVLHAFRRTRKGKGGSRRIRWSSHYKC